MILKGDEIKVKLNFYKNDKKKTIQLHKINFFYGYAGCGKTTFAEELEYGLLGKDRSFAINNLPVVKEEKNVILINSKESILDHIKLSSKSYIKKYYYEKIIHFLDDNPTIIENINNNFAELNNFISAVTNEFNQKATTNKINISFGVENNDDIINNFMKVLVDSDSISSSSSKELLLMLILILNDSEKETHIIIDDFDSFLDEQTTIRLLRELEKFNGYIYLFSNKPNSILYAIGKHGIFNIREKEIYDLSNIMFILKKSLENDYPIESQTYEEYMINFGYFENSGNLDSIYKQIKNNSIYNFGRMLTSKQYKITDAIDYNYISIIPASNYEESFLKYVDMLLNNN